MPVVRHVDILLRKTIFPQGKKKFHKGVNHIISPAKRVARPLGPEGLGFPYPPGGS